MASPGVESDRENARSVGGWGIYDRLKKVPPISASKDLVPPRMRRIEDQTETSETAARRIVEDMVRVEGGAPESPGDYLTIESNMITHRKHRKEEEADITVCECVIEEDNPESACGDQCLNMMSCNECTPGFCPSKELCRNQRFQHRQYAQTRLVKTENRGWGLAIAQDLKAGDFVIEYCGEVVPFKEAFRRSRQYETAGLWTLTAAATGHWNDECEIRRRKNWFLVNLNDDEYIDATHSGNVARFINHSCEPNCETLKWTVLGEERLGIFALEDVSAGTELTYDYKPTWYGGSRMRCFCETSSCAGFFGLRSKAYQIYTREGAPFGKDAYTWEDDVQRRDVKEVEEDDDDEYDAPLSSFMDPSLIGRRVRNGVILNSKDTAASKISGDKILNSATRETAIKKETPTSADTYPVATSSVESRAAARRRREPLIKKDKLKSTNVLGKFRETSEPKAKKIKVVPKVAKLEWQAGKSERVDGHRSKTPVAEENVAAMNCLDKLAMSNVARVDGFRYARTVVNRMLLTQYPRLYPVSEASYAEVEFDQELEAAAASDVKKLCEEAQPAVLEYIQRRNQSPSDVVPAPTVLVDKWIEARCKHLRSLVKFHYSITRHLSGPVYGLCSLKDAH